MVRCGTKSWPRISESSLDKWPSFTLSPPTGRPWDYNWRAGNEIQHECYQGKKFSLKKKKNTHTHLLNLFFCSSSTGFDHHICPADLGERRSKWTEASKRNTWVCKVCQAAGRRAAVSDVGRSCHLLHCLWNWTWEREPHQLWWCEWYYSTYWLFLLLCAGGRNRDGEHLWIRWMFLEKCITERLKRKVKREETNRRNTIWVIHF